MVSNGTKTLEDDEEVVPNELDPFWTGVGTEQVLKTIVTKGKTMVLWYDPPIWKTQKRPS